MNFKKALQTVLLGLVVLAFLTVQPFSAFADADSEYVDVVDFSSTYGPYDSYPRQTLVYMYQDGKGSLISLPRTPAPDSNNEVSDWYRQSVSIDASAQGRFLGSVYLQDSGLGFEKRVLLDLTGKTPKYSEITAPLYGGDPYFLSNGNIVTRNSAGMYRIYKPDFSDIALTLQFGYGPLLDLPKYSAPGYPKDWPVNEFHHYVGLDLQYSPYLEEYIMLYTTSPYLGTDGSEPDMSLRTVYLARFDQEGKIIEYYPLSGTKVHPPRLSAIYSPLSLGPENNVEYHQFTQSHIFFSNTNPNQFAVYFLKSGENVTKRVTSILAMAPGYDRKAAVIDIEKRGV